MNFCAMLAHMLWTAVLSSMVLGLVTAQSVPTPAHISSSYVNRLLTEYGMDGGLSPAGLQRLMEQLGIDQHHSSSHGHHHGHSDHTDHEHSQRAPADHESGLEHRDGGGDRGTHAAHPDGDWTVDHSHGTKLLHETDHHHALSHDHQSEHHHQQDGEQGQDDKHDHDDGSHDLNHGSHDHDHGSHDHDHGSHDHDHGSHDHDRGSHDHDHRSHDHDHSDDHDHGHANVSTTDQSTLPERHSSRSVRDAKPQDLPSAEGAATVSDMGRRCPDAGDLLAEFGFPPSDRLSADRLSLLCPALVYHAAADSCAAPADANADAGHEPRQPPAASAVPAPKLWLFAGLSVLAISLCGLAGVAVVPIMQRVVYRHLLQFLVALAVGTLAGDALLHLLPHALVPHGPSAESGHDHDHGHDHSGHDHSGHLDAVLKGLVALVALVFFFAAERGIGILHGTCTRSKHKKINKRLADMPGLSREETEMIERKINNYRHSSGANHCFGDRGAMDVLARLNTSHEHDSCPAEDTDPEVDNHNRTPDCSESQPAASCGSQSAGHSHRNSGKPGESEPSSSVSQTAPALATGRPSRSDDNCKRFEAEEHVAHSNDFTVIIHEHEHRHHGHTHTHGHIHQPAGSAAAVAGMVIVGDGLHNFTDGMAIGAAFAAGLASGLSTSVAVFCHELPHEIGDFAVLLQSGMSVRQALFYNVVSSVLCLLGMVLGMVLGNMAAFSSWVFAAAAGSFLYIALVDMVPELTAGSGDSGSSPCSQLAIQLTGMTCGATIMLTIAIYENDLHSLITVL